VDGENCNRLKSVGGWVKKNEPTVTTIALITTWYAPNWFGEGWPDLHDSRFW